MRAEAGLTGDCRGMMKRRHRGERGERFPRRLRVRVLQPKVQRPHQGVEQVRRQRRDLPRVRLEHVREQTEVLVAQLRKRQELVRYQRDHDVQPEKNNLRDVHLLRVAAAGRHPVRDPPFPHLVVV